MVSLADSSVLAGLLDLMVGFGFNLRRRQPSTEGILLALVPSAFLNLGLLILSEKGILSLGLSWLAILGTGVSFGLGYVLSPKKEGDPIASKFHSFD